MRQGSYVFVVTPMRVFQHRKRYEVTCDKFVFKPVREKLHGFQYRKRYEVTCDGELFDRLMYNVRVSIPQAV